MADWKVALRAVPMAVLTADQKAGSKVVPTVVH
jgi:hypothetical protein